MNNIELFDKHFSGNLTDSESTEFYSKLATDENLQSELKAFASVKRGIQQNINSFAPSSALKSAVFANAGFSGSTVAPVPKSANSSIWSSKFFTGIFSAVSGVVITLLFLKTFGAGTDNSTSSQYVLEDKHKNPENPEYVVNM